MTAEPHGVGLEVYKQVFRFFKDCLFHEMEGTKIWHGTQYLLQPAANEGTLQRQNAQPKRKISMTFYSNVVSRIFQGRPQSFIADWTLIMLRLSYQDAPGDSSLLRSKKSTLRPERGMDTLSLTWPGTVPPSFS
jgi:hypothetical protein